MATMKRVRSTKGFTLIEILIAVTLLAIGLLGMAGLTVGVMKGNSVSSQLTAATALAQDKMEDIKRMKYGDVTPANLLPEDYNSISGYANYKRDTDIDVDTPSVGMKTVTVTVSWDSDASSIAVETILTP